MQPRSSPRNDEAAPATEAAHKSSGSHQATNNTNGASLDLAAPRFTHAEPVCVLVASVQVRDDGSTRDYIYKSLSAAEAAVDRARKRGRDVTVTLCELRPVAGLVVT